MQSRQSLRSRLLPILLAVAAFPASATTPTFVGALPTPANRIVGVWNAVVHVGPCNGQPVNQVNATVTYHTGGTLSETNTMPIAGIPNFQGVPGNNQRGPGTGAWRYNWQTGQYTLHLRFNWFVDGVYNGYQDIVREGVLLSADGSQLAGPVHATRYFADGTKYAEFCGYEDATRF